MLAVLVALDDEGLEIFPTHRLTSGPLPRLNGGLTQTPLDGPGEAAAALAEVARDRPAFVLLSPEGAVLVEGGDHALDTALVDSLPLEGVDFTPSADGAERAVATGQAAAAFLVRPPTVQQVEEFARAGVRMPQKSTYFFPSSPAGSFSPLRRVTGADWLEVCRDAAAAVSVVLDELPTRLEREAPRGRRRGRRRDDRGGRRGRGSGGRPARTGSGGFTLVSEELGRRVFGDGDDGVTVVCDPIDGSLNAKRGIRFFALAGGRLRVSPRTSSSASCTTSEPARSEQGPPRRGRVPERAPADGPPPKERIEILSLEATRTDFVAEHVAAMVGFAVRTRVMGSLALSLCHPRRPRRRGRLAEAGEERGHRRRAAPRPRARPGDRPARRPALRRGAARPRRPFLRGCGCDAGGLRRRLQPASAPPIPLRYLPCSRRSRFARTSGPLVVRDRVVRGSRRSVATSMC